MTSNSPLFVYWLGLASLDLVPRTTFRRGLADDMVGVCVCVGVRLQTTVRWCEARAKEKKKMATDGRAKHRKGLRRCVNKRGGEDNALKGKADWRTICGVWRLGCKEVDRVGEERERDVRNNQQCAEGRSWAYRKRQKCPRLPPCADYYYVLFECALVARRLRRRRRRRLSSSWSCRSPSQWLWLVAFRIRLASIGWPSAMTESRFCFLRNWSAFVLPVFLFCLFVSVGFAISLSLLYHWVCYIIEFVVSLSSISRRVCCVFENSLQY